SNLVAHTSPTAELGSGVLAIVAPDRIEHPPTSIPTGDAP
ncbi:MAG: hypothetical protein RLZZ39_302, partial [Actinomycetota bacterium]